MHRLNLKKNKTVLNAFTEIVNELCVNQGREFYRKLTPE